MGGNEEGITRLLLPAPNYKEPHVEKIVKLTLTLLANCRHTDAEKYESVVLQHEGDYLREVFYKCSCGKESEIPFGRYEKDNWRNMFGDL